MATALLAACSADKPPETTTAIAASSTTERKKTKSKPPPKPLPDTAHCPTSMPGPFQKCPHGAAPCSYPVKCQSGSVNVAFSCGEHGNWSVEGQACSPAYDSCPGTALYCQANKTWWLPTATNPPSPCPKTRPKAGASCRVGGFGGVWEHCGYPCAKADTPWVVASCERDASEPDRFRGAWKYDKACP